MPTKEDSRGKSFSAAVLFFMCIYVGSGIYACIMRDFGMYARIAPLADGYGDMGGLFFELCLIEFLKELAGIHDAVRAGT